MFPYSFANLVLAATFIFVFLTDDTASGQGEDLFFILLFLGLAKYYYGKEPKKRSTAIAFNIAVFPLFLMNLFAIPSLLLNGKSMIAKEWIYIYPLIYLPLFYIIISVFLTLFENMTERKR